MCAEKCPWRTCQPAVKIWMWKCSGMFRQVQRCSNSWSHLCSVSLPSLTHVSMFAQSELIHVNVWKKQVDAQNSHKQNQCWAQWLNSVFTKRTDLQTQLHPWGWILLLGRFSITGLWTMTFVYFKFILFASLKNFIENTYNTNTSKCAELQMFSIISLSNVCVCEKYK